MYEADRVQFMVYGAGSVSGNIGSSIMSDNHRPLFLLSGREDFLEPAVACDVCYVDGRMQTLGRGPHVLDGSGKFVRVDSRWLDERGMALHSLALAG